MTKNVAWSRRISGSDIEFLLTGEYLRSQNRLLRYLLKGASDQARKALRIHYPGNQRRIEGKRAGASEGLGAKARARFAAEVARRRSEGQGGPCPSFVLGDVWPWDLTEED